MSRVLRNARAASGVEATTMLQVPIFRYMTGPYFLAMLAKVTWGMLPRSGRAPITGHPFGPGGSFRLGFPRSERTEKRVMKKRIMAVASSRRRNMSTRGAMVHVMR